MILSKNIAFTSSLYMPRLIYISLYCFVFFTNCTNSSKEKDERRVFNYNEMNGVTSLDPAAAANSENIWPVNLLFNGLVQMDDHLNVQPCIAKSYSMSEDALIYTFHLRNDVYFHDNVCFENGKGRRVIAKDFEFSFNRLFDSKVSSATTLLDKIDRSEHSYYKGFNAINDSTFQVRLKIPFNAFINILTMKYFSVIPYEAIDMYGLDFRRNPVGTGAFRYKLWEEGTKLILLKNENYFEYDSKELRLPYLDAVTISFIKDRETAFMELLNGKFDMISGSDAFNLNEVLDKEGNLRESYQKKFYLQKETYLKTDYIGILVDDDLDLVKNSPLRHKAVRQAINYAFDRDKLINYLRNNIGKAAHSGFIPEGMKSYDSQKVKGYTYDPEKVRALLKEAGYPNGKGLPQITVHVTDNSKEHIEFIQSQLAENNIRINISIEKPSVLRQAVNSCEYSLFKKNWVADYADEENFMSLFYSKNFSPQGVNFFHFKSAAFDSLYESAQVNISLVEKIKLYQSMERILIEEAPVITLYYDQVVRIVSHQIQNLTTNPMNLLNLKTVRKL